jgi:hypothetical protein
MVKAGRRGVPRMRDHKPGARIFDRSISFARVTLDPVLNDLGSVIAANRFRNPSVRLGSRKNFFAKRRMRAGRCASLRGETNKSDSRVGGNLLCEIAHYVLFFVLRGAHASRVLVLASRQNNLLTNPRSRDAIANAQDTRATQSGAARLLLLLSGSPLHF